MPPPSPRVALTLLALLPACGAAPGASGDDDPVTSAQAPGDGRMRAMVGGVTYAIHVGGLCSTGFVGGKGGGELGHWQGVESVDAAVDQRASMAVATADLAAVLDEHCLGDNQCYVLAYSNGGAVISRALSLYGGDWNILYVLDSASNEGGSELGGTGWLGEAVGSCALAGHVGTTDHRSGWNHDDTGGATFYQLGGTDGFWYSSLVLPKSHDGAVSFHSAAGLRTPQATKTLCHPEGEHWTGHEIAWTCAGYPLDHYAMKMKGVCELGGCASP